MDDWQESADKAFFAKIQQAIDAAPQGYGIDGNYTRSIPVKWQKVDSIIWLDLSFYINLYRAVRRALSRAITKQHLWPSSNNRESFGKLLSRDSIILWMMKIHQKNRQHYQKLMQQYPQYRWIRLSSVHAMKQFLATQPYKPK